MSSVVFEWDKRKDEINQEKHGVSFKQARQVFEDPKRLIVKDITHSTKKEDRLYCISKVKEGVLMVRFTYRDKKIRIFGAGFWRKGRRLYEQKHRKIY